jgi:hypothetical protein
VQRFEKFLDQYEDNAIAVWVAFHKATKIIMNQTDVARNFSFRQECVLGRAAEGKNGDFWAAANTQRYVSHTQTTISIGNSIFHQI